VEFTLPLDTISDESFQAIDCTGTDNYTQQPGENTHQQHKKTNIKTNWP